MNDDDERPGVSQTVVTNEITKEARCLKKKCIMPQVEVEQKIRQEKKTKDTNTKHKCIIS